VNFGIFWEIDENPMGTDGDTLRRREKKIKSLCPHLPQREKKLDCS
jgi:hypothetical protein